MHVCTVFEGLWKSLFYRVPVIGLFSIYDKANVIISALGFMLRSGWGLKTSLMVSFGLESAREGRLILFIHLLRLRGQSERERPWVLYKVETQEMEC